MTKSCDISIFYLFLKLGIWQTGEVSGWGTIKTLIHLNRDDHTDDVDRQSKLAEMSNLSILRRPLAFYLQQHHAKQLLSRGVYLLDYYTVEKPSVNDEGLNTHLIIIATSSFSLEKKEHTYVLRVSTNLDRFGLETMISDDKVMMARRPNFRRR
ncbi:MAG: hypothetical protein RL662_673 [Bacteroidota bacterium]|jgi:hypothetical protein